MQGSALQFSSFYNAVWRYRSSVLYDGNVLEYGMAPVIISCLRHVCETCLLLVSTSPLVSCRPNHLHEVKLTQTLRNATEEGAIAPKALVLVQINVKFNFVG